MFNDENATEKKGFLGIAGGCFLKVLGFVATVVCLTFVSMCSKTCSRMMVGNQHGQKIESFSYDKTDIDNQLRRVMEHLRKTMPQKLDEVTIARDVDLDDKYFYYIFEIDDTKSELFWGDAQSQKNLHREYFFKVLPNMKVLIECLIETERGLVYRYNLTSSNSIKDFTYSKEELQDMLENIK